MGVTPLLAAVTACVTDRTRRRRRGRGTPRRPCGRGGGTWGDTLGFGVARPFDQHGGSQLWQFVFGVGQPF